MPNITKPTGMSTIWATSGIKTPPANSKIAQGWVVELPPYQTANYIENKQDQFNAHVNQHGVPVWDSDTEYQGGISYTKGSDGKIYKCISTHKNFDPVNPLNSLYWTEAFEPFGSVAIVQNQLNALLTNYATLSGIANVAAARANLSVYSKLESDLRFAALNGSESQVFSVAPATLGSHAVRLDQINSLITQATESTPGVAKIASSLDMSAGTNDTNIVTPLKGHATYLKRAFNLSDLTNVVQARINLGLGSIATEDASNFLRASNNLSELVDKAVSRTNLGLGSAAVQSELYFLRSGQNLADLLNIPAARANLGLGTAATANIGTAAGTVAAGDDPRIVNAVPNTRTVTAGNGLTGGGALINNVTLNMGTPSTLSIFSTNTAGGGTHNHAINMASFFPTALAGTGEVTFFNGLRFAWGTHNMGGGPDEQRVNFRIPFTGAVLNIQLTNIENFPNEGNIGRVRNIDLAGFTLSNRGGNTSTGWFWFAIGV
jgi:hypothetical protein